MIYAQLAKHYSISCALPYGIDIEVGNAALSKLDTDETSRDDVA